MNEQEKWNDAAREMFSSEGWANFMKDIADNIDNIRIEHIDDEKGFWIAKGQLNILHTISGWEAMIRAAEEQAEEDGYAEDF